MQDPTLGLALALGASQEPLGPLDQAQLLEPQPVRSEAFDLFCLKVRALTRLCGGAQCTGEAQGGGGAARDLQPSSWRWPCHTMALDTNRPRGASCSLTSASLATGSA